jgi:DNA-binding MarR family transcriptional regulator
LPSDLRPAQFSALAIIEQNPGLMQADLARALAIEPPQVVLLNKLESRALAVRMRLQAGQALLWDLPQQARRNPAQDAQRHRR